MGKLETTYQDAFKPRFSSLSRMRMTNTNSSHVRDYDSVGKLLFNDDERKRITLDKWSQAETNDSIMNCYPPRTSSLESWYVRECEEPPIPGVHMSQPPMFSFNNPRPPQWRSQMNAGYSPYNMTRTQSEKTLPFAHRTNQMQVIELPPHLQTFNQGFINVPHSSYTCRPLNWPQDSCEQTQ